MGQININVTPELERNLARLMRARGIATKSEAIRVAVEECARAATAGNADFEEWLGLGLARPENPERRFATHDDLWES